MACRTPKDIQSCALFLVLMLACGSGFGTDASLATPAESAAVLKTAHEKAIKQEDAGDLAAAEAVLGRAIAEVEAAGHGTGADYGIALHRLARLRSLQDKDADNAALHERAVAAAQAELGLVHPRLAPLQIQLAGDRLQQKRYEDALPLYRRAIEGLDHPEDWKTQMLLYHALTGLAQSHMMRREFAEAVPLFERGMQVYEAALGSVDGFTAWMLGDALLELDLLERAAGMYELAVAEDSGGRRAAENLAGIRALGPYMDPTASGPAALQTLRQNLTDHAGEVYLLGMAMLLERRAARQYEQDPGGTAWRATCEAQAEVEAASHGVAIEARRLGYMVEQCLKQAQEAANRE